MNIDINYQLIKTVAIKFTYQFLLLLAVLFFFALPISAKKDKKKKITNVEMLHEPDAVCKRAKPDRHPHQLDPPGIGMYAHGSTSLEGFDISHHNGKIDWQQFSTDPNIGFVYMKSTEGAGFFDSSYEYNISEARRHGIKVGTYHFFRPNVSAREQFANFSQHFDPKKQDLLPVVDVETAPRGMSITRFQDVLEDFCIMIEKEYGRRPMIYTGRNFYDKWISGGRFSKYKFWIATYSEIQPVLRNDDDYLIWQYTSTGRARGVKGNIDKNKFVGRHVIGEIKF